MSVRSKRIEVRIKPESLALVQRASELTGCSVSEYLVTAAENAARTALEEAATVRLSVADQRRFVELLLHPPQPTPALSRAHADHAELIDDGVG